MKEAIYKVTCLEGPEFGQGIFEVKVASAGLSLRESGSEEWKFFSYADLLMLDANDQLRDADFALERYRREQADELRKFELILQKLKAAVLKEVTAYRRRHQMQIVRQPKGAA